MGYSSLCQKIIPSPNHYNGRKGYKICKFTPHHVAGKLTAEQIANIFKNPVRNASATYCIGYDGGLVGCVDEKDGPWTSSSLVNDCQAITVEVSNCEIGGEWRISNESWNTLVNLAVDVCRRHNFRLFYDGTPNGSLTRHNMFANTNCPGPYLQSKFPELARTVNAILDGDKPAPVPPVEVIDVIYQTYIGYWLPNAKNCNNTADGYAGIYGKPISAFRGNSTEGELIYKSHSLNGKWHDEVRNRHKDKNGDDYAGILGRAMDGIMIKHSTKRVRYRCHQINGMWLPWVDGYNENDSKNGYAGNLGHAIDGIQVQIIG